MFVAFVHVSGGVGGVVMIIFFFCLDGVAVIGVDNDVCAVHEEKILEVLAVRTDTAIPFDNGSHHSFFIRRKIKKIILFKGQNVQNSPLKEGTFNERTFSAYKRSSESKQKKSVQQNC